MADGRLAHPYSEGGRKKRGFQTIFLCDQRKRGQTEWIKGYRVAEVANEFSLHLPKIKIKYSFFLIIKTFKEELFILLAKFRP